MNRVWICDDEHKAKHKCNTTIEAAIFFKICCAWNRNISHEWKELRYYEEYNNISNGSTPPCSLTLQPYNPVQRG